MKLWRAVISNVTAEKVTKALIRSNRTITFMESCTAGLLASMFTDTEGASAVFKGSFVTYSNEAKTSAGVDKKIIEEFGVYSAECAKAMAQAAKASFGSDIAVGVTGTTGNVDPCNPEGNRGEVFYCIIIDDEIFDFSFGVDVTDISRKKIKQTYANTIFDTLYELLTE